MDFYLFQSVEQPTRSNNILEHLLTNTPSFMFEPKTGPQFRESGLSSDHFPVFFDFAVNVNFKDISRLKRFDFKNANFESLKQVLLLTSLSYGIHNVNSIEDLDSLWNLWNDFVFTAVDTFVPKVNYKDSNRPPWISKDLAKDINNKETF